MDESPIFLIEEAVCDLHAEQIRQHGGKLGIRDPGGLSAAIASPENTFYYVPDATIFDLAAGYAYHISMSQAFLDGNKRTGLHAALTFLDLNGFDVEIDEQNLFDSMLALYEGPHQKAALAERLRQCSVRVGGFVAWLRRWIPL